MTKAEREMLKLREMRDRIASVLSNDALEVTSVGINSDNGYVTFRDEHGDEYEIEVKARVLQRDSQPSSHTGGRP